MSTAIHTWPRLYIKDSLSANKSILLDSPQSHYLCQVMRLRSGDQIRLFNGTDGEWQAALSIEGRGKKTQAILFIQSLLREQKTEPDLWLCAAPIKRSHFEYAIIKATELGASAIQPIFTSRTQVKDINSERLHALIIEAAEQSERMTLPIIKEPLSLNEVIQHWPKDRLVVLCAEHGHAVPLGEALSAESTRNHSAAAIFTGPEGGFTSEELEKVRALPHHLCVRLGPRILRADTAAIAAMSVWQALCGDWTTTTSINNR